MLEPIRAAWRRVTGQRAAAPDSASCLRCADLSARIEELQAREAYWRAREERATEALLVKAAGVQGVALTPKAQTSNPIGTAMAAMAVSTINSKQSQPGQGVRGGAH